MNESDRDRRLDSAWSAASREEPPPALDAAIRAAARRAVKAAPGRRRNKHWLYPLAAAATVAVLAVGIARLTPPERVAPTTVADTAVRNVVEPQPAASDATPPPAARPPAAPSPPKYVPPKPATGGAAGGLAGERGRVTSAKPSPEAAGGAKAESSARDKLAAAPEMPAASNAPSASAAQAAPPAALRSEPFPAARTADARRDAYVERPTPDDHAPAGATPGQAQAQSRMAAAKVAADAARVKDASTRGVEEWIKRIRDLKSQGRFDEAAKELAAFRAAYGERADALLPADLRLIKP